MFGSFSVDVEQLKNSYVNFISFDFIRSDSPVSSLQVSRSFQTISNAVKACLWWRPALTPSPSKK